MHEEKVPKGLRGPKEYNDSATTWLQHDGSKRSTWRADPTETKRATGAKQHHHLTRWQSMAEDDNEDLYRVIHMLDFGPLVC